MSDLPRVEIYCDGACSGNPGPGGWAAILRLKNQQKEIFGGECETTNNRMEIMAALEGLRALKSACKVVFYTDSSYLLRGATEWLPDWKRRNWQRKEGKLANVELWQEFDREMDKHQVSWVWVKGHAGNRLNERVDWLARGAIPRC
ncbi:MAG: ribonuclease HI [Anaerolineaceae bacterium]